MKPADVRSAAKASRRIHGWFSSHAAALFGLLDDTQHEHGISGDLFEIGAHHGKSAVLLARMAGGDETVGVCDIFGSQELNASGSGSGDRAVFERNMATIAPGRPYKVFEKLSNDLTADEVGGPIRFFHVDGGHLAEEALSDLRLAASVLDDRGVIAVDDPYRHEWPGVTEAIIDFCRAGDFKPVAVGFNKLILARQNARRIYDDALAERQWDYFDATVYARKELPIVGATAAIYRVPSTRTLPERFERLAAKVSPRLRRIPGLS